MSATKLYHIKKGEKFLLRESSENDSKVRYGVFTLEDPYGSNWKCVDANGETCYIYIDTVVTRLET